MVDQKISEFNSNYLNARNKRLNLEAKIKELEKHFKSSGNLSNTRSLIGNQSIETVYNRLRELEIENSKLARIFKAKHPKMIQITGEIEKNKVRLNDELEKELANLKSEKTVLLSKEKVLKQTIGEFENDALDASSNELEYSMLQRNLNTSKHLYDTLLTKIKESDILKTSDPSNIRIVEEAVAYRNPLSPNKRRNFQIGAIVGLLAGVLFAFFLEYMDQTIRTEEDIQNYIGRPVLSIVPIADETTTYGSKK